MKVLISAILLTIFLSSCKNDREYIKGRYFSMQNQRDLEKNRYHLYRQSHAGLYAATDEENRYFNDD